MMRFVGGQSRFLSYFAGGSWRSAVDKSELDSKVTRQSEADGFIKTVVPCLGQDL
jgi:hypothetical protein